MAEVCVRRRVDNAAKFAQAAGSSTSAFYSVHAEFFYQ